MKKKILSLLIVFAMMLSMVPMAFADGDEPSGDPAPTEPTAIEAEIAELRARADAATNYGLVPGTVPGVQNPVDEEVTPAAAFTTAGHIKTAEELALAGTKTGTYYVDNDIDLGGRTVRLVTAGTARLTVNLNGHTLYNGTLYCGAYTKNVTNGTLYCVEMHGTGGYTIFREGTRDLTFVNCIITSPKMIADNALFDFTFINCITRTGYGRQFESSKQSRVFMQHCLMEGDKWFFSGQCRELVLDRCLSGLGETFNSVGAELHGLSIDVLY